MTLPFPQFNVRVAGVDKRELLRLYGNDHVVAIDGAALVVLAWPGELQAVS